MCNICRVEVLSSLGIQIPRPGGADLGMALLEPVDPVQAREDASDVEHKGAEFFSIKWLCNGSLIADPIHKCLLFWRGKDLFICICDLLVHTPMQAVPQCSIRNLMINEVSFSEHNLGLTSCKVAAIQIGIS
jgi:hypothetical protein